MTRLASVQRHVDQAIPPHRSVRDDVVEEISWIMSDGFDSAMTDCMIDARRQALQHVSYSVDTACRPTA